MITVSVIIPCYKSAKTLPIVVENIKKAILAREGYDYQIILVNDYPYDETFGAIRELCRDEKVIGVNLSKNFGQTAAKMAGLKYFSGDVLVYMDDDGQHPADQIYLLVDKVLEGYDMVYAYFPHKKHSLFKRFTSYLNNKLSELKGTKVKNVHVSSYHALSKFAAAKLKKYKSPFPSIGGYLHVIIKTCVDVELEHRERISGESNYTLRKLFALWLTTFTNFSLVPLRLASIIGFGCSVMGFLFGLFVVLRKIINPSIAAGYTSSIALQLFIGGIIMLILGLIGEYIGRIYMTISDLPQYVVREELNSEKLDIEELSTSSDRQYINDFIDKDVQRKD